MTINRTNTNKPILGMIAGIAVVSMMLAAGCGNQSGDATATGAASPAATSANVPPAASQTGQGAQQMGAQRGGDAAANAAAMKAAEAKAGGK